MSGIDDPTLDERGRCKCCVCVERRKRSELAEPDGSERTDAERLDWLERTGTGVGYNVEVKAWGVDFDAPYGQTIREAIDAAMEAPNDQAQRPGDQNA